MTSASRGSASLEVIAHRGYSAKAPENTLVALRLALDAGAPSVEFDVHVAACGTPVLFHDDLLDRTTDGTGPVADRSHADLARLDAGGWFSLAFRGEPVPTLAEALAEVRDRAARVYPEIKAYRRIEDVDRVLREVEDAGMLHRAVFISMDWSALDRIRERNDAATIGFIAETPERLPEAVSRAAADPHAILDPDYRILLADPVQARRAVEQRVPMAAWTVDDPSDADRLADLGVTRFTTNQVTRLLAWARERARRP